MEIYLVTGNSLNVFITVIIVGELDEGKIVITLKVSMKVSNLIDSLTQLCH